MSKTCNAAINLAISAILIASLSSCNKSSDKEAATAMLSRADSLLKIGEFKEASLAIDAIDSLYPGAVDIRRQAMNLKPRIAEGIFGAELSATDSLCAVNQLRMTQLQSRFTKVNNEIEPYYIIKGVSAASGLSPRLSPDGMLYIISTLASPKIGHTSIAVNSADGASASTSTVPRDGERNSIIDGAETVVFIGSDADTVGSFVYSHLANPLTLIYKGASREQRVSLDNSQASAIATAYEYARLIREAKVLNLRKEALERKLAVARSQQARTLDAQTSTSTDNK